MSVILLAVPLLSIAILCYYLWIWTYWLRRGVAGPLGLPFVGSLLVMLNPDEPPYLRLKKWSQQYRGGYYGLTEGTMSTLVLSDPLLIHEVFVKQYDNFFARKLNPIQGDPDKEPRVNLFSAHGFRWKRLRAISSPTFSNNSLKRVMATVEASALELLAHIEHRTAHRDQIDMLTFYQEYTMDVIGRIAMGQTDTQMFKNPLLKYVKAIFGDRTIRPMVVGAVFPFFVPIFRFFLMRFPVFGAPNFIHISKTIVAAVEKRIQQRKEEQEAGIEAGEPNDFIDLFLDARADDVDRVGENNEEFTKASSYANRQLTTEEIVGQLAVFLIAGFDTTALSLSFCTHLLATNRDVQTRVQMEIDAVCGDPSISFDQLARLKYLDQVVKETLRLYPLGALANSRKCMRATKLGDVEVEVGTMIQADTWSLHTNTDIWGDDANEFRPERWAEGTLQERQRASFISFGSGPRQCIGMRLAYMEEKMLLAHILRKYTFETGKKTKIPMKLVGRATTQPESVWMHLTPRYA